MEMTVIGYDPYITEERAHQVGVELVDFDTLLAKSDYITIHTPLTKETENMINAETIAKERRRATGELCPRCRSISTLWQMV